MKAIELEARQEFIFKVGSAEPIKMELRRGLAEVYGTEMLANKTYTFPRDSKASVFTYHGATIEMTGTPLKSKVIKNCDYMTCYLNISRDLEAMRDKSTTPICLVCESRDARNVGKSTLCRILLNYATRRGWAPIFVDLDPDQGYIGLPGTIGALSIESPVDIETGFQTRSSMLLHFGHTSPLPDVANNSGLNYKAVVDNLAKIVHSKLEQDKKSRESGVIINSSSWTDSGYYKLLLDTCKSFKTNMVLVVDDEVLQDDLQKDLADCDTAVKVINVPKTVDIYKLTPNENVNLRYSRIKEYFYGTEQESYNPMTSEVKFSFLKRLIYRIMNPLMVSNPSWLPLGQIHDNRVKVSHFDCTASDLLHHILAISYSKIDDVNKDPEGVLKANIMGFICITSVRADGEIVSILTPQKLPSPMDHVLLYSDIQYMDSLI